MEILLTEQKFNLLIKELFERYFKPLGYKKERSNFRLYQEDGLCKIVNFQKSSYNAKNECSFTINMGIYFEEKNIIKNLKFKEYDCQIRERPGKYLNEEERDIWWTINKENNISELNLEMEKLINDVIFPYFNEFKTKNQTIERIIDGSAQKLTDTNILYYDTVKLLKNMGYEKQMLNLLKSDPEFL